MGAVLALAGKKTIILEFDIRKPKVLSGLGMPKGPGITNFLVGKSTLAELIRPVPTRKIFLYWVAVLFRQTLQNCCWIKKLKKFLPG